MQDSLFSLPPYLSCLSKSLRTISSSDGLPIEIWELNTPTGDLLSVWAKHFRQHYCLDAEIDQLREGTGLSRAEFLTQIVFPDKSIAPGPGVRSGDFAELLIADYVDFILGYWVPRNKYSDKNSRDESVKGVDILGFKVIHESFSPNDTLIAFEVKAQSSGGKYSGCLQTAIDDSSKDFLRRGTTLNAIKRRLLRTNKEKEAMTVQRFQNQSDHPYIYKSGAAAILSDEAYDEEAIRRATKTNEHLNMQNLEVVIIRGKELMTLIHALYENAANEA